MPVLLEVIRELRRARPDLRFEIAAASAPLAGMIREGLADVTDSLGEIAITIGQAAETMQRSAAGVVTSGTATLEAAFFRLPFVLVYKVATMTYLVGKMLIRVPHLGMPNVLARREIVPEFIQRKARPEAIAAAVLRLLEDPARRAEMLRDFDEVIGKLGPGGASENAARVILQTLAKS
jgi:lipid-A-disaccharide synthase